MLKMSTKTKTDQESTQKSREMIVVTTAIVSRSWSTIDMLNPGRLVVDLAVPDCFVFLSVSVSVAV